MPPDDFEVLIAASDLMLSDNAISASLGKAVCLGRACAVLVNSSSITELYERRDEPGARWAAEIEAERPGAIFPWDVFPIWNYDDVDRLGFGKLRTLSGDAPRASRSSAATPVATPFPSYSPPTAHFATGWATRGATTCGKLLRFLGRPRL